MNIFSIWLFSTYRHYHETFNFRNSLLLGVGGAQYIYARDYTMHCPGSQGTVSVTQVFPSVLMFSFGQASSLGSSNAGCYSLLALATAFLWNSSWLLPRRNSCEHPHFAAGWIRLDRQLYHLSLSVWPGLQWMRESRQLAGSANCLQDGQRWVATSTNGVWVLNRIFETSELN